MYHLIRLSGIQAATSNKYNLCLLSVLTIMQEPFSQETNKQTNKKTPQSTEMLADALGEFKGVQV